MHIARLYAVMFIYCKLNVHGAEEFAPSPSEERVMGKSLTEEYINEKRVIF